MILFCQFTWIHHSFLLWCQLWHHLGQHHHHCLCIHSCCLIHGGANAQAHLLCHPHHQCHPYVGSILNSNCCVVDFVVATFCIFVDISFAFAFGSYFAFVCCQCLCHCPPASTICLNYCAMVSFNVLQHAKNLVKFWFRTNNGNRRNKLVIDPSSNPYATSHMNKMSNTLNMCEMHEVTIPRGSGTSNAV